MEDPLIMKTSLEQKDISPFESAACENYLKSFQLNVEELVPETKDVAVEKDVNENQNPVPNKIKSRRPTIEVNGVQVKPKTLAEYREALESSGQIRKSKEFEPSDIPEEAQESSSIPKERKRRSTTDSKVERKSPRSENNPKSKSKCDKQEAPSSENTVTRSGRVSKKVLKQPDPQKEKSRKHDEGCEDDENFDSSGGDGAHVPKQKKSSKQRCDYFSTKCLLPDTAAEMESADTNVIMYTGAGRHLHSYAIHNYNLLTENKFNISTWQRDFALTALSNNIDKSTRSIYRSSVPLVSKNLIKLKDDIKEGKFLQPTKPLVQDEVKTTRGRKKKKKSSVWTKVKTHHPPGAKKEIKDEITEQDLSEEYPEGSDDRSVLDETDNTEEDVETGSKRKLNPEVYGLHKRVKLKLIQTQTDSKKKPQWTSVNCEREDQPEEALEEIKRPEETEEEMQAVVSTVMDKMLTYVELNTEFSSLGTSYDPTYTEEYKLETDPKTENSSPTSKRKRNNSSRVKWELKKLDVLIFEHDSDTNDSGDACVNDFCKLGCVCESISVKPKNIAINHCSEINCIFQCVCPAPRHNENKPPIRDESEIIRSVAEKRNGRNLAKKEKEWIQTLVKTNDEYVLMKKGNKSKREVKKPERYREESLHWENVAHQKLIYDKMMRRNLREKAKKSIKEDKEDVTTGEESVSLKEKKRAELKLLKRLRKKRRLLQLQQEREKLEKETTNNDTAPAPSGEKKTSPLKFYFCKEHKVLDCKCKAKKQAKEDDLEEKAKEMQAKLDEITERMNSLNYAELTSEDKDKLLSLMREKQSLETELENRKISTEQKPEQSVVEEAPPASTDDEFMDLDKLSKFIPKPDGNMSKADVEEIDVDKCVQESALQKMQKSAEESTTSSQPSEDMEMIVEEPKDSPISTTTPKLLIKSVKSLQAEEFNKDQSEEVQHVPIESQPNQELLSPFLNTLQQLTNSTTSLGNNYSSFPNQKINFYGFILHNGIGYLPISMYFPRSNQIIIKDPTKKEPIVFSGSNYIEQASLWANTFLKPYIKFYPENLNPLWRIIKLTSIQELQSWKLFDFKFLKQYTPMVLTKSLDVYKNKNKTLFKLLFHPVEKVYKFKRVMGAKLDMDDIQFITKYEFIASSNMKNNNNNLKVAPTSQNPNEEVLIVQEKQNSTVHHVPNPNIANQPKISIKPPEVLMQKAPSPVYLAPLQTNGFNNNPTSGGFITSTPNMIVSNMSNPQMNQQIVINRSQPSSSPSNTTRNNPLLTQAISNSSTNLKTINTAVVNNNMFFNQQLPKPAGISPQTVQALYKKYHANKVQLPIRHSNLPNLNSLLNKKPLGYNQGVVANSLNSVKINNNNINANINNNNFSMVNHNNFIQLSQLISANSNGNASNINKSHPILSKSLETPPSLLASNAPNMSNTSFVKPQQMTAPPVISFIPPKSPIPIMPAPPNIPPVIKKSVKRPPPGLKSIKDMERKPDFSINIQPSLNKMIGDEVAIVPSNNPAFNFGQRRNSTLPEEVEITRVNSIEPNVTIQELNNKEEISIVECVKRFEHDSTGEYKPITITPNGEDTVTISPIISSNTTPQYKKESTIYEKLTAMRRIKSGEPLDQVARSLQVTIPTIKEWINNFQQFEKRASKKQNMRPPPPLVQTASNNMFGSR